MMDIRAAQSQILSTEGGGGGGDGDDEMTILKGNVT